MGDRLNVRIMRGGEAARLVRLVPDGEGLPARAGIAANLRSFIQARGTVGKQELSDWICRLGTGLGFDEFALRQRVEVVLAIMIAAGDLAAMPAESEVILALPHHRCIAIGSDKYRALGEEIASSGKGSDADLTAIIRPSGREPAAIALADFLGEPHYRKILAREDLKKATLNRSVEYLVQMARTSGDQTPSDIDVIGTFHGLNAGFGTAGESKTPVVFTMEEHRAAKTITIPNPDILGWLSLCAQGTSLLEHWNTTTRMPGQILKALSVCGTPRHDRLDRWSVGDDEIRAIASWIGLPEEVEEEGRADAGQEAVISKPHGRRLLVEAGPGSGKTWVACSRVSNIVEQGVASSRIVIISFTRVAVAELRARIAGFLENPAAAAEVQIVTLDSLAWTLRHGFSDTDGQSRGSHEDYIAETAALLKSDADLRSFVGKIEHLIVDEMQDLSGARRDLVAEFVKTLSPSCGVTAFFDSAQAIYDFGKKPGRRLWEIFAADGELRFERLNLNRDHRTRSASLKSLFVEARSLLTDGTASGSERYDNVRDTIEAAADRRLSAFREQAPSPNDSATFVLCRDRGELLSAASDLLLAGRAVRMRLAGRKDIIAPWIGISLGNAQGELLDRSTFSALWEEVLPRPSVSEDAAWKTLRGVDRTGNLQINLGAVREKLSRNSAPFEVIRQDLGSGGPLLTTIHGAKGREADHVRLIMPREPDGLEDYQWEEEARVLFVGATRARRTLEVGAATTWFTALKNGASKRLWQKWNWSGRQHARAEVGMDGDVDEDAQIDEAIWEGSANVTRMQALLWELSERATALKAVRKGNLYELQVDGGIHDGMALGRLSRSFTADLWTIGKLAAGERKPPPAQISRFYMVGARTVARVDNASPRLGRFYLSPIITGVPAIFYS